MQAQSNLIRKQFLISETQAEKLNFLAREAHVSAAEMVRNAIDAFNPDSLESDMEESELLELVHSRVKEAIKSTQEARKTVRKCLNGLSSSFVGVDEEVRTYAQNMDNSKNILEQGEL